MTEPGMGNAVALSCVAGRMRVLFEDGQEAEAAIPGRFRAIGLVPKAGDALLCRRMPGGGAARIERILPRKNELERPPIANLDRLFIVASPVDPRPDLFYIDKLTAMAFSQKIEPVLVLNKTDVSDPSGIARTYLGVGIKTVQVSAATRAGIDELLPLLAAGSISAFVGQSGVGKSSLLNCICPGAGAKVGDISSKLKRGRHTTRAVELFRLSNGGFIADTPGFTAFEAERLLRIRGAEVEGVFPEFGAFARECRYRGCTHTKEEGCAVIEAVAAGFIPRSRYESYVRLFESIGRTEPWRTR